MAKNRQYLPLATAICVACAIAGCRRPTAEDTAAKPWMDRLEHFRPEVRTEAIRTLSGMKYRAAARRIAKRINDVRPDVRLDAIKALGELGDPATVPDLGRALSETEWVHRKEAVAALARIGHPAALPLLIHALADRDQAVGRAAAAAAAAFGPLAEDRLLDVLSSGPMTARPNAAAALGLMKSRRAADPLRRALAVSNSELRVSATIAFASVADEDSIDTLAALMGDRDPSVSRAASAAVARMGNHVIPALTRTATNMNGQARMNAYRVLLGRAAEPGVLPVLLAGWDDRNPAISSMVRQAFTANDQPSPVLARDLRNHLREALANPSEPVRLRALDLIEPVADGDDTDAIAALLDDRSDRLRRRAAAILAGMRDDRARKAVRRLAASASEDMRFLATTAMASRGDEDCVTNLIALLETQCPPLDAKPPQDAVPPRATVNEARIGDAMAALGRSRDPRALPVLSRMLAAATHPTAFLNLCQTLSEMRRPEAFPALAAAAGRSDWRYREGRSVALRAMADSDPKRAVDEYARHLTSPDYQETFHREVMLQTLGRIADPRGVPHLVSHLVFDNEEVRRTATQALIGMKDAAVPGLLAAAGTTNRILRAAIAFALANMGPAAAGAVNAAVNSQAPEVREVAAWTVGQMEDPSANIAAVIGRLNTDTSPDVRAACAWAAGKTRSADEAAMRGLTAMLRGDSVAACRHTAAFALGEIASTSSVPALVGALADADNAVRAVAAGALGRIAAPEVIAPLRSAAEHDVAPEVRSAARNALIAAGQPAEGRQGGVTQ